MLDIGGAPCLSASVHRKASWSRSPDSLGTFLVVRHLAVLRVELATVVGDMLECESRRAFGVVLEGQHRVPSDGPVLLDRQCFIITLVLYFSTAMICCAVRPRCSAAAQASTRR